MKGLPERLKKVRGKLNQADFAEGVGISARSLSRYETGASSPDLDTIEKICAKYDVSAEWLIFGIEPGERVPDREKDARIKSLERQLAESKDAEQAALRQATFAYQKLVEVLHPESTAVSEPGASGQQRQHQPPVSQQDATYCHTIKPDEK